MLREKSISQYQTIVSSLSRDLAAVHDRFAEPLELESIDGRHVVALPEVNPEFIDAFNSVILGYVTYYRRHNVHLTVVRNERIWSLETVPYQTEVTFINNEQGHFINISGTLAPYDLHILQYSLDITENITDMQNIQNILKISAIIFSIIAAIALYFILSSIFKPLSVIATASEKIADGQFGERIEVKGKNELAQVALDFNKMAERIEEQILFLEEEAVNKQQFVDNFAHEIRTPLTSIYGYAEYLQKATLDEKEIIESAEYIMNEANHMKNIANSLLELATLRNYVPEKDEIIVTELFEDLSQAMDVTLQEKDMRLTCINDTNIIYGQKDLIRSLLLNLCANALNACTYGEGIVQLEIKKRLDSEIAITVTDNGVGIPAENLAKITEPFYRIDKSRSRECGGTGLGLALCRQIVELHGGEININSTENVGTTVEIIFTTS